MTRWIIREAVPADAEQIGMIQVSAWRAAYREIFPAEELASLEVGPKSEQWRERLESPSAEVRNTVAVGKGEVAAFCSLGPSRDEAALRITDVAELYALYASPCAWGAGAGFALFRDAIDAVVAWQVRGLSLWVFEKNLRGRAFYERQGLRPDGARIREKVLGVEADEIRYSHRW